MAALSHLTPAAPRPLLVGREREQAVLRDCLAHALTGQGSLVLLSGEAGIGKTALAEVLLAEAATQGALVLVGRCYDLSETPPYGPWAEVLARAPHDADLPVLPTAVLPPDQAGETLASQEAIIARVQAYLAALAARQPLVLLLDDLHWADPASLDLLRVLARDLADLPLLLLVTYRSDELTRRHLLYQLLPLLVRESHAQRLDLHPLDDTGLRALVAPYALPPADAARLAAYLDERSEGNPFFAGELLRALEEGRALRRASDGWRLGDLAVVGVPPLLRQVLDVRLDRLGEDARDLLAVAAVIGQTVPFAVWQAVAGADEGALLDAAARATAAHLLTETPDGSGVRFAHALVREALYEGLLLPRRRAWHRRAAEALVAQPHPDPDPIAHHFRRAGDARAADWLVAAGEQAEGAFAWLSAAARFEEAAALLDAAGGGPTRRGWLHFRLASLRQFADPQRSLADLGEAARLADAGGDAALAAGATYQRGKFLYNTGERRRGLEAMASGDRVITALPPPARARLAAGPDAYLASDEERRGSLAEHFAVVGRYAEAGALTGWSSDDPAGDAAAPTGREALALAFAHIALGRPAAARRALGALRRAELRLARHAPLLELVWVALPYRADHLAERGTLAAEAAAVWTATSGLLPAALPNPARLPLLIVEGGWAEARAHAEAGYAVGAGGPLLVRSRFGALARVQGDAALARTLAHEEFPLGPDTPPGDADYLDALGLLQLAAALALDAGEQAEARAWLEAHDRWLAWSGAVFGRAEGALGWAAYHRAAGDPEQARQHAGQARAYATEPRQPLALLAAHRCLGELATAAGDHAEAATQFDAALTLAVACAAPYERALTLLALAELRLLSGDTPAAQTLLDEARALLEPLAARPALARADALAVRLTATPTPAYPAGLSAREVEVLRLVAAGLTNAQVAARLYLSPRTVDQHLRTIYNKIGVDNRTAAARWAAAHALTGTAP